MDILQDPKYDFVITVLFQSCIFQTLWYGDIARRVAKKIPTFCPQLIPTLATFQRNLR